MTPRRQWLPAAAGLAGIAVLGAVAVVLLWNGGSSAGPEPTVSSPSGIDAYADLGAYKVHFGDTLTAKVEVTVDRSLVDPGSIRVNTDFTPWKPTGPPDVLRRDGKSTTYLETRYTLRCLESFCTTPDETAVQRFRPARISYAARGDSAAATQTVDAAWPELLVAARYAPPSVSQGVRQPPTRWQADLVSLPAATYRLGPWLLVVLLLGGAVLLTGAAVAIVARTRPRSAAVATAPAAPPSGPVVTALEVALALLEDPARVNGSGDQRRALELVADGLVHRGDGTLARTARTLAWSRHVPRIEETQGVARDARKALGEESDETAP